MAQGNFGTSFDINLASQLQLPPYCPGNLHRFAMVTTKSLKTTCMALAAMLVVDGAATVGATGGLKGKTQLTGWIDLYPPSALGPGATPSLGLGSPGEAANPSGQLWQPSPPAGESQDGTPGGGMINPLPHLTFSGGGMGGVGLITPPLGDPGTTPK